MKNKKNIGQLIGIAYLSETTHIRVAELVYKYGVNIELVDDKRGDNIIKVIFTDQYDGLHYYDLWTDKDYASNLKMKVRQLKAAAI